jgi:hypothetical protein
LLEKWKFAEYYIHTALHHNSPDPTTAAGAQAEKEAVYSKELLVVQSASQIVNSMGYDILASGPADIDLNDVVAVQQLNLEPERVSETKAQVTERMKEIQSLF